MKLSRFITLRDIVVLLIWPTLILFISFSVASLKYSHFHAELPADYWSKVPQRIYGVALLFWLQLKAISYTPWYNRHKECLWMHIAINCTLALIALGAVLLLLSVDTRLAPTYHLLIATFNLLLQVVIYTVFIHLWYEKQRRFDLQLDLTRTEIQLLRWQNNPHFLFNTLNLIAVEVTKRPQLAKELIYDLSDVMRCSLMYSQKESITIQEELELIGYYLSIQKARFAERLNYQCQIDVSTHAQPIPALTVLPLVENAIKYALSTSKQTINITIKVELNNGLDIKVINSWPHESTPSFKHGTGLHNLVQTLKLHYQERASFNIEHVGNEIVAQISIK